MTPGPGDVNALVADLPRDIREGHPFLAVLDALSVLPVIGAAAGMTRRAVRGFDTGADILKAMGKTAEEGDGFVAAVVRGEDGKLYFGRTHAEAGLRAEDAGTDIGGDPRDVAMFLRPNGEIWSRPGRSGPEALGMAERDPTFGRTPEETRTRLINDAKLKAQEIANTHNRGKPGEGGSTIDYRTGKDLSGTPFYSVAIRKGDDKVIEGSRLSREDVEKFIEDHWDELQEPGATVGTWWRDDGAHVLDVVRTIPKDKLDEAVRAGVELDQDALFDLEKFETVYLKDPETKGWTEIARPVAEELRQQRAVEQGFNYGGRDWYHGTGVDFPFFKSGADVEKRSTAGWDGLFGAHFSESPEAANVFADRARRGRVLPVRIRLSSPKVYGSEIEMHREVEGLAKEMGLVPADVPNASVFSRLTRADRQRVADEFKRRLVAAGHDGIEYGNVVEGPTGNRSVVVFAPGPNVRSKFAKFDPANIGKSNLLGSGPAVGPIAGGVIGGAYGAASGETPEEKLTSGLFGMFGGSMVGRLGSGGKGEVFRGLPSGPWAPTSRGVFDRSAPKIEGTIPDDPRLVAPSNFRGTPSPLIQAIVGSRSVRAGLNRDVDKGIHMGAEPWFELGPQKADLDARKGTGALSFEEFNILGGASSASNSVANELAAMSVLNFARKQGMSIDEARQMYARVMGDPRGVPLMPSTHGNMAERGLAEGLILPLDPASDAWKIAMYANKRGGGGGVLDVNAPGSWPALDTHERRSFMQLVMENPRLRKLARETGAIAYAEKNRGVIPLRNVEDYKLLSGIYVDEARKRGMKTAGSFQAPRWVGGGERTGLRSAPYGDFTQILEDQLFETALRRGLPTDPKGLTNLWRNIMEGKDFFAAWGRQKDRLQTDLFR